MKQINPPPSAFLSMALFSLIFIHSSCLASQPMVSANIEKCHLASPFLYPIYIFKILCLCQNLAPPTLSLRAILDVSRWQIFPALPFLVFLFLISFSAFTMIYKLPIIIFHFIWQFGWQWFVSIRVLLVPCCSWCYLFRTQIYGIRNSIWFCFLWMK